MKIALLGATGNVGASLLAEAQRRGHAVTALARRMDPASLPAGVRGVPVDATNEVALAAALRGHDAVLSAVKFRFLDAARLVRAVKAADVSRLLVVGGAGSLEVAPGVALVDTPQFPIEYQAEALAGREFLRWLRTERELDWTFLSPAAELVPGPATGKARVGEDRLLVDGHGRSWITLGDYAAALLDELTMPRHSHRRFTVGY